MPRIEWRNPMAPDNTQLVRRILDEIWNQRNFSIIDELLSADFAFHDPMSPSAGTDLKAYRQFIDANLKTFPDLRLNVVDIIGSGEIVATRWQASGTHKGELAGHAPTGKTLSVSGMNFARVVDGKCVESWGNWDALGMMQQLGLLSAEAPAHAA